MTTVKDFGKSNVNYLFFLLIVVSFLGSLFLAFRGFQPGTIYSLIIIGSVSLLFLVIFFLKDDDRLSPITKFVKIPLTRAKNLPFAVATFLLGWTIPFILNLLLRATGSGFSVTSFAIPFYGAEFTTGFQQFATAEIGSSMPWKIFTIVNTAGTAESLMYLVALPFTLVLIGFFITKMVGSDRILFMSKKNFIKVFMVIGSTIMFMLSHLLNNTYVGIMFFIAGIFMVIQLVTVYWSVLGIFNILFWIGYHQSNNFIYLLQQEGTNAIIDGLASGFGALMISISLLMIFYVVSNWKKVINPA